MLCTATERPSICLWRTPYQAELENSFLLFLTSLLCRAFTQSEEVGSGRMEGSPPLRELVLDNAGWSSTDSRRAMPAPGSARWARSSTESSPPPPPSPWSPSCNGALPRQARPCWRGWRGTRHCCPASAVVAPAPPVSGPPLMEPRCLSSQASTLSGAGCWLATTAA